MRRPSSKAIVSFVVVAAATVFVLTQLQPRLLFTNTTPAGGDMGAHVWTPAYLRDHLLPNWRLTGWSPDWYAGMPTLHYYFPIPSLAIVVADLVLPYGIAFKLVTVLGLLSLPAAAYAFGRLAGFRFPVPACLAVATLPFLFDRSFTIFGGNILSTLAGEFSFSISLSFALLFLGVLANGLTTGRRRALAAVLLALTGLCHILPAFFAVVGAIVLVLMQLSWQRLRYALPVFIVAALISAWWTLPFVLRMAYTNDMGWTKEVLYLDKLFPPNQLWLYLLAAAGAAGSLFLRRRAGAFLILMALASAAAFRFMPQGRLWNARMLPFWYLCLYLLAGVAIGQLPELAARLSGWVGAQREAADAEKSGTPAAAVAALGIMLVGLVLLPFGHRDLGLAVMAIGIGWLAWPAARARPAAAATIALVFWFYLFATADNLPAWNARYLAFAAGLAFGWSTQGTTVAPHVLTRLRLTTPLVALGAGVVLVGLPLHALPSWVPWETTDSSIVPGWSKWNYEGYERKAAWPEYHDVNTTMARVGREHGCGRAMWEYEGDLNRLGTPMALMLLPYWTDGCIGSMEGLYFESSATTPYHFMAVSEVSLAPSRPQQELPYRDLDLKHGVEHLQLLGVRYYLALSDAAKEQARTHPDLTLVAETEPWSTAVPTQPAPGATALHRRTWQVYLVENSALVEPLRYEPVVMEGVPKGGKGWQRAAVDFWSGERQRWEVPLAASGPKSWRRVQGADPDPPRRSVRPARVTNIVEGEDRITFDVDRTGSPVLVKTSYFPNWQTKGADGPWRVTPNLMVVIPTSRHVELHYGYTPVDVVAWLSTFGGIAGLIALVTWGPVHYTRRDDEDESAVATFEPVPEEAPLERVPATVGTSTGAALGAQGQPETPEAGHGARDPAGNGGAGGPPLLHGDWQLGDPVAGTLGAQDELGVEEVGTEPALADERDEGLAAHDLHPVGVADAEPEAAAQDEGEHRGDQPAGRAAGVDRSGPALGGDDEHGPGGEKVEGAVEEAEVVVVDVEVDDDVTARG